MPTTINGSTGASQIQDNTVSNAKVADDAIGLAELSATGTPSSSTFLRGDNAWAAAGGGKILQVQSSQRTSSMTTTSTSYSTIQSVSITPSATTSKIMIFWNTNAGTNGDVSHGYLALFRDTTEIGSADTASSRTSAQAVVNTGAQQQMNYSGSYLDSPSSTSAISYVLKVKGSNTNTFAINRSARDNDAAAYDGRSTTTITAIEVGA